MPSFIGNLSLAKMYLTIVTAGSLTVVLLLALGALVGSDYFTGNFEILFLVMPSSRRTFDQKICFNKSLTNLCKNIFWKESILCKPTGKLSG